MLRGMRSWRLHHESACDLVIEREGERGRGERAYQSTMPINARDTDSKASSSCVVLDSTNSNIVNKKKRAWGFLTLVIKECRRIRAWM